MSAAPLFRYRFGQAEFDESRFELRVGGLLVELQAKPLRLLALLLATPRELVPKDRIFAEVWADRATGDAVLANAVSKLRGALGAEHAGSIVTVPRLGYRFDGDVERSAVGRRQATPAALAAGMPVPGRHGHRLLRRLGSGSGQEAWLAEQPRSGDRRVFKFALDGDRLADLKREVTLARVLQEALGPREDFVRVLDWQFEQPPYWLESAWAGEPLQDWATLHLAALPPDARTALALQLADAMAAAHGAAVLHKDLKPSNVLVAPRPGATEPAWQLRIADFGSGRLLDSGQLERLHVTRLGLTLDSDDATSGTPYYIAPELLAGGTPSAASDVFALGVMLFQLLAGDLRCPLLPGWERAVEDELLREDIAAATDIDPQRRLASAAVLAQRLRSLPERRAARARREADAREQQTVRALNRLLREDLIGAANPARSGRADITVAEALTGAAERIEEHHGSLPPAVRGSLHLAMQQALSELSRSQEAVQAGLRALATLEDAAELREARLRLALDLVQLSRLTEAAEVVAQLEQDACTEPLFRARLLFVKSWLVAGDLSFEPSLQLLQEAAALVAPLGEEALHQREVIEFALADNLVLVGRHAEAEALFRQLHSAQVQRLGAGHLRPSYTLVGLGNAVARQGRRTEARTMLQSASEGLARSLGPQHRQTLSARDRLANLRFDEGDWRGAAADWREVHAGFVALLGAGSSYTLTVATNLACALHRAGDTEEALAQLGSALALACAFLADTAPQVQQIRFHLAACRLDLGLPAGELAEGLEAQALNTAQPEADWPERLQALRQRIALTSCT